MRKYEIMFIVRPDLEEKEIKEVGNTFDKVLKDQKANVISKQEIGQRNLAYPILKHTRGYYFLYKAEFPVESTKEIDRLIRINENIIRHMIINIEE